MREVYNKQSLWSKILNNMFIFFRDKHNTSSEESARKHIAKLTNKPRDIKDLDLNKENVGNQILYTYNGTLANPKEKVLLYIHGGNFVERANKFQVAFAKSIALKTGSTLILPLYELLPNGNYKKMYDFLDKVYDEIIKKNIKEVNFLGDSAGGGVVLSLAMQLRNRECIQPVNIVLLSPWLDLSMTNPNLYEDAKKDKMNGVDGTRYEGKLWAHGLDVFSPIVSPMYGSFENLGKISIIFGGKDILVSECKKFDAILTSNNIDHNYILYEQEGHDFAAFPTKEGRMAIEKIVKIINSQ